MHISGDLYIPVGSISVTKEESQLNHESWNDQQLRNWATFAHQDDSSTGSGAQSNGSGPILDPESQATLLKAPKFSLLGRLFRAKWARLAFRVCSETHGTVRVYLLPDDMQRRTVDRSNFNLKNTRLALFKDLDYAKSSWNGSPIAPQIGDPVPIDSGLSMDEDTSLLKLFNNIPSPSPDPSIVLDDNARDAMFELLESNVPGLTTELYAYQRRSAALMVQKESAPGVVLDPRLIHIHDQLGSSWYMDPIAGTVLLEPRHYDGVFGGILAEEMGSGKTIICLALILATKNLPSPPPEIFGAGEAPIREKVGSLADMAASCATRHAVPWKPYFDTYRDNFGLDFNTCVEALQRNPGYYLLPAPEPRRSGRYPSSHFEQPKKIYLSSTSLIVVPNNLLAQWKNEIRKHTENLRVLTLIKEDLIPPVAQLLQFDAILFSQGRFERILKVDGGMDESPLSSIHFRRSIVDEGHKLGNSRMGSRSNLLLGLNALHITSRWVVTGTPSQGLYGLDSRQSSGNISSAESEVEVDLSSDKNALLMEKKDLERIGSIAALYLKARPWANTTTDTGDTLAEWSTYLMLPKHNPKSHGRWDCLKSTLNSLIVRHRLAEVGDLLPPVNETIVVLDGSYQDQLSLNLFSMMIIFNSVQSQRTDMDYFFHPKQRKSLLQIVHNLKQTSFFGGSFFAPEDIKKSIETAETFLEEKKIPIIPEDESLLVNAIKFGRLAVDNRLRNLSNQFHEMPILVKKFPARAGQAWSLDGEESDEVCTSAGMLLGLQKLIYDSAARPEDLNALLNGGLVQAGQEEKQRMLTSQLTNRPPTSRDRSSQTLAGNTKLGDDSPRKSRSHGINGIEPIKSLNVDAFSGPLELTEITSTVSAKLSYLIDGIVRYQDDEKIIVFYENDNVAWYLASVLDVLQIQHLIYAKGISMERRAQYVNTFHYNPTFRVLLMDLSQAAFGLDIRAASRIYFISPVLNPQVEAQAIGRVRRVNQQKAVSVETLVLRGSIDEVLLERKKHMTQAEHRQVKSILDIRPIFNWIKNASIIALPEDASTNASQMIALNSPLRVFGRGFGRPLHPDEGLVMGDHSMQGNGNARMPVTPVKTNGVKRALEMSPTLRASAEGNGMPETLDLAARPARRVRFAG